MNIFKRIADTKSQMAHLQRTCMIGFSKNLKAIHGRRCVVGQFHGALDDFQSIQSVGLARSWFGSDYKKWGGVVPGDDEEFQSCIKSTELGLANCVNGDCICSHFAFYTQRAYLDTQNILERYGSYMTDQWAENSVLGVAYRKITEILSWINRYRETIKREPAIYTSKLSWRKRWKTRIAKWKIHVFKLETLPEIKADFLTSSYYTKYIDR